jgi:hypothetical protein
MTDITRYFSFPISIVISGIHCTLIKVPLIFRLVAALYLDVLLKLDSKGEITTQLYYKRDDFNFSIVNFPKV